MAIPVYTGQSLNLSQIATEFGGTAPHNLSEYYAGAGRVPTGTTGNRPNVGVGAIPGSGSIHIGNFYGSASTMLLAITASAVNVNLYNWAIGQGWNGSSNIQITINSGVIIYASSTSTYALTVSSFPSGTLTLINNGYIVGAGGAGGNGAYQTTAANGGAGGHAINAGAYFSLTNNGVIGGGGGGGGGGYGGYHYGGSGGGGGAGQTAGSGGAPSGGGNWNGGYWGNTGGLTTGGAGMPSAESPGGAGGAVGAVGGQGSGPGATSWCGGSGGGGGLGARGGAGAATGAYGTGGAYGAAGYAAIGNGYITWNVVGSRYGPVA